MSEFKINRQAVAGLFFLLLIEIGSLVYVYEASPKNDRLVFLNVGQGDAILFETAESKRVLIDGGPDESASKKLNQFLPWWDRELSAVVATHSDLDHIGGLEKVINGFKVGGLYMAKDIEMKPALADLLSLARRKNVPIWLLAGDYSLNFSSTTIVELLIDRASQTSNENSIVSILNDRGAEAVLLADVGGLQEEKLLAKLPEIQPDIIKIGHHGSDLGTSEAMLDKWRPGEAVISVGKNNRFGHPSQRVIKRLERKRIIIKRTDEQGDIIYGLADGHWRPAR